MTNSNGLQRTGKESGRWYCIQANSAFLLTEVSCAGKLVEARMVFDGPGKPRPDIPPYECAYCHKPIMARELHWSGSERRHKDCPVPMRSPTLTDAKLNQWFPGVSGIRRMRAADELMRFRENKTARHGVAQGANFLRDALAGKFQDLTGTVDAEAVRAMLTSSFAETEAVAESLMIQAVEAYESEGEDITDEGTAAHAAIARFIEQKQMPEDERWARTCLSLASWLKSKFGIEDVEGQTLPCWCEVPIVSPTMGFGGTADLLFITDTAIVGVDHKSKRFSDIRTRLAALRNPPPFHCRPWTSDLLQAAAYRQMLSDKSTVIGQSDRHGALRQALAAGLPVQFYEHYLDRDTGESWTLDWQTSRLDWQKPEQRIHVGLDRGWYLFNCLRLLWLAENEYEPTTLTGYDALGRPFPGELDRMETVSTNTKPLVLPAQQEA